MKNQQGAPEALRFTKKPVTIEAIQWTGKNLREVITFTDGPPDTRSHHAGMAWEAYADLVARDGLKIYTLEGKMLANVGDWIIRGVKGEFYPCKPDIFEATYSPAALVEAQQPAPSAGAHKACKPDMLVNGGALKLALNVLRRAGKNEVADELEATAQPSPTPQADSQPAQAGGVVAYLDIGAGGYLDLGTDLTDEALSRLPKGRHALVIAGTYGIDGYTPAPPAQAADSVAAPAGEVVAGIEAAAKLLERKADDFARENGSDDLGSLSFGRGAHADAKLEYHSTLLELAEEIRSLAPPPPAHAADSVLEDAARWQALPAFFEEYQIDAMKLYRDIDAYLDAARKQGANHE